MKNYRVLIGHPKEGLEKCVNLVEESRFRRDNGDINCHMFSWDYTRIENWGIIKMKNAQISKLKTISNLKDEQITLSWETWIKILEERDQS